jgi:heptosyltransferase-1
VQLNQIKRQLYAKIPAMPRILLVKTSSLGDVVHNLPVASDIRRHFPDAQIDWVVEESFAAIPAMHPAVRNIVPVALRRWRHQLASAQTWREIAQVRQTLKAETYDTIIDTQGLLKSALIGNFANGLHHGYDNQSAREPLACLMYEHKHKVEREQHAIVRNRQLVAKALGYAMLETAPDYGIVSRAPLPEIPGMPRDAIYIVGLHATSRESKLWPVDRWITLAGHLAVQHLTLLLPWNTEAEHSRAQFIATHANNAIVLPRLPIDRLAAVLAQARAAVGVDTGLSHLAAALGIPTLALYTDTDPGLTGVYAGAGSIAVNLGGKLHIPTVDEAAAALQQILVPRA